MLPKGLLKELAYFLSLISSVLDMLAMLIAGGIAYIYKFNNLDMSPEYITALLCMTLIMPVISKLFIKPKALWRSLLAAIQSQLFVFLVFAAFIFVTKTGDDFSREWFMVWMVCAAFLTISFRVGLWLLLRVMKSYQWKESQVVLIGGGEIARKLIDSMRHSLWTGFSITAVYDDNPLESSISEVPIIKTPVQLDKITENNVDEVWIALPLSEEKRVKEILHELRHYPGTIRYALDFFGMNLLSHSMTEVAGFPILNLRSSPMVGVNRVIKAIEDRVLSAVILLFISPLCLLIAVAIKLGSRGPIFYRQSRIGWNGKEFTMLKFRTMPVDIEEETGPVWASPNEVRATKLGAFLRRTSLDELPQFINVLRGEMSIVGPRPERMHFVEQFKDEVSGYMQKHLVKAGITGWAQINGWRGNTSLEKRIEHDLYYIQNWSLFFDIKIILLTIFHVWFTKNAY